MATRRNRPFIYVTWLRNYLIGENLCRWSIWHRVHFNYEKAKSSFDSLNYTLKHTALRNKIQRNLEQSGYEIKLEHPIYISGEIAELKGKVDIIALREDRNLIIECKTGKPSPADRIQLMLYLWALPITKGRFNGAAFDGLLVYEDHEIEISALDLDETFLMHFKNFTKDILSSEPDRKYPSPKECGWCAVGDCDEKANALDDKKDFESSGYVPDFF